MQPEPTELSNHILNTTNASEPPNASQYGFLPDSLHSAELRDYSPGEHGQTADAATATAAVEAASTEVHEQVGQLNQQGSNETRPKPSFQQISEYENALSPSPTKRQSEGPGFKVIKKKGNNADGPQLTEFPNGTCFSTMKFHLEAHSNSEQRF